MLAGEPNSKSPSGRILDGGHEAWSAALAVQRTWTIRTAQSYCPYAPQWCPRRTTLLSASAWVQKFRPTLVSQVEVTGGTMVSSLLPLRSNWQPPPLNLRPLGLGATMMRSLDHKTSAETPRDKTSTHELRLSARRNWIAAALSTCGQRLSRAGFAGLIRVHPTVVLSLVGPGQL